jgi:hypothetical protein
VGPTAADHYAQRSANPPANLDAGISAVTHGADKRSVWESQRSRIQVETQQRTVPAVLAAMLGVFGLAIGIALGAAIGPSGPASPSPTAGTIAAAASAPPAATPSPTPAPSPIYLDLSMLEVGHCFNPLIDPDGYYLAAAVVDCHTPHEMEALGHHQYDADDGAPFPTVDQFDRVAEPACDALFVEHVGRSYFLTPYDYGWVYPGEISWQAGDRTITCMAMRARGGLLSQPIVGAASEPTETPTGEPDD